ncbi:MAG: LysR family transcriptional regulator [Acidobacteriaceae bacterium]
MTLAQLQAFQAVLELKSFTEAAERLCITQSAISHAIRSLEEEFGLPLFMRDRNGVALTQAGQLAVEHVREILGRTERIRQEISALSGLRLGKVRVGSFQSVAVRILPSLVRNFHRLYPGLEMTIFEGTCTEVQEWLFSGTVDIGFVVAPCTGLESVPVLEDEIRVVLPKKHPLGKRHALSWEELGEEPLVVSRCSYEAIIASMTPREPSKDTTVRVEARNIQTVIAMVREGVGIALVPSLAIPEERAGLVVRSLEEPLFRTLLLATCSVSNLNPAGKAFWDHAKAWVPEQVKVLEKESGKLGSVPFGSAPLLLDSSQAGRD